MEFDFTWLLLGLPLAFGLGWLASRLDLRQLRELVAEGVDQAIVGKALYEGAFTLAEAIEVAGEQL